MDTERIPVAAVMPYVDRYVTAWGGGEASVTDNPYLAPADVIAEHPEWGTTNASLPLLLLAERTGISPNTLHGWLRKYRAGQDSRLGFFDADRILTALDRVGAWQGDPVLADLRDQAEAHWASATVCEHD